MNSGISVHWSDSAIGLQANQLDIWYLEDNAITDGQLFKQYWDLLDAEEKATHDRFRFKERQHQYIVSHALIRTVLSLYACNVQPNEWRFHKNAYGKPYVLNSGYQNIKFNLTHTSELIALAVMLDTEVGIDAESIDRSSQSIESVARYFSASEYENLIALAEDDRVSQFRDLWTLKEAYAKACGMGLSVPLSHTSFSLENNSIAVKFHSNCNDASDQWRFWQMQDQCGRHVSVALKTPSETIDITFRQNVPLLWHQTQPYKILKNTA